MRSTIPIFALCALALPALSQAQGKTEYLLIPMSQDISGKTQAKVLDAPHPVTFSADDCGISAMVGGSSEVDSGSKSEHYSGTAYSSELQLEGSGQVSGFVMLRPISAGTELSNFKPMEDGQTCSEKIGGKVMIFKKYSAVWRQ
jgi:hypothetical protein